MLSPAPSLAQRLRSVSERWATVNDATLARLGKAVVNDTSFFNRLDNLSKGVTTDTLERFARFLADGDNWPDGAVPEEARQFAHVTGVALTARDAA